jgi:hypothetical protein
MGTRGFIGFVIDGTEKIAYNHWDSYPSGLGLDVLKWLRDTDQSTLHDRVLALRVVDENAPPTAEDVQQLAPWTNLNVSNQSTEDWYCLLRDTQGDPEAMLKAGVLLDGSTYAGIEYSYFVDLDTGHFLAYDGARRKLLGSWPMSALPADEEFLKIEGAP